MEEADKEKIFTVKVVLIGDSGVGKTTLIDRYVVDQFDQFNPPTISGGFRKKVIKIPEKNAKVTLQIWDTAGQEKFKAIVGNYYKDANWAIVVYDTTSTESFESAKNWIKEVRETAPEDVMIYLWGSKVDLKDNRQISLNKASSYANNNDLMFGETSAKNNIYVTEVFESIAHKYIVSNEFKQESDRRQTLSLATNQKSNKKKGGWKC